ncbi:hypothetical protein GQ57_28230 [Burkholderia sp. MSh2]|uniref:Acetoacetate decarboxylase n=1 Tax=Burkholderia paludis TaxID=1506587 RepID=A0A6P2SS99_9BURK|nr:DUF2071 domain-containing protein [Burkholderia sp. MSh2]KEZ02720.1 hypothetical protein GQ57_28230 [Burkholderia sp. MSh2]CAB3770260.1 hypothetical protein LMG30113_06180 [Burkholderia paludis]VWC46615.1 hypothetical protein BPA30113_07360 [Burkholderia paludis]
MPVMLQDNTFVYPSAGLAGRLANRLVASRPLLRARRALLSRLPFLQLASDVENVVYCTWLVDVAAVAHLVPPGITLASRDGRTPFTILTYAHRHFGPRVAGPLRRVFPSPLQSNWRLYVDTLPGGVPADSTVLFVKNVFDHPLYALGSRLFSDALPSHLAGHFTHAARDGHYRTRLSGGGSAPDFSCTVAVSDDRTLPAAFAAFFGSWRDAVATLSLQHAAVAHVDDCGRLAHASIELPIDLDAVRPLKPAEPVGGGAFLARIGATGEPLCFVVPDVAFRVLSERLL